MPQTSRRPPERAENTAGPGHPTGAFSFAREGNMKLIVAIAMAIIGLRRESGRAYRRPGVQMHKQNQAHEGRRNRRRPVLHADRTATPTRRLGKSSNGSVPQTSPETTRPPCRTYLDRDSVVAGDNDDLRQVREIRTLRRGGLHRKNLNRYGQTSPGFDEQRVHRQAPFVQSRSPHNPVGTQRGPDRGRGRSSGEGPVYPYAVHQHGRTLCRVR